jgi:hypothetical protein
MGNFFFDPGFLDDLNTVRLAAGMCEVYQMRSRNAISSMQYPKAASKVSRILPVAPWKAPATPRVWRF